MADDVEEVVDEVEEVEEEEEVEVVEDDEVEGGSLLALVGSAEVVGAAVVSD